MWKENRYGNFDHTEGKYRVKFQDTSFRIESKVVHESGPCSWIKIGGGYYKDVTFPDQSVIDQIQEMINMLSAEMDNRMNQFAV